MAYYNSSKIEQPMPPPPQPPQGQDQPPIVCYATPAITHKTFVAHYHRETSIGLGVTQIIAACVSISAGVMAIEYDAGLYYVGIGIWAGAWYLMAGSLAMAAGIKPKNSLIIATLVFSVLNMIFGFAEVATASFGITAELYCFFGYPPIYEYSTCVVWWVEAVAANSMMIAVGSLEIIFGLWMTVISGHAIRKGSKPPIATISVTFAPNQPESVFIHQPLQPPPPLQSEPPPYYDQPQYPSTSNQQQMIHIEVDQQDLVPSNDIKY